MKEKIVDTLNNKVGKFWGQYFFFALTICVFQNFFIPYLHSFGLSEGQISNIMFFNAAGIALGNFVNGYISDRFSTFKKPLIINLVVSMVVATLLIVSSSEYVIWIVAFFIGMTLQSMYTIIDTWILYDSETARKSYSKILSGSSIGRVVCSFGLGLVFLSGYDLLPYIYIGLCLLAALFINTMRDKHLSTHENKISAKKLFNIVFNWYFLRIALFLMLFTFGMITCQRAQFKLMDDLAAGSDFIGIFNGFTALCEVAFLFFINRYLKNIKITNYTTIGAAIILTNLILLQLYTNYWQLLISAVFYAGTFAFTLIGAKFLIVRISPAGLETTTQAAGSTIYMSVGIMLNSMLYGYLADNFGLQTVLFWYSLGIAAVLLVFFVLYFKKDIRKLELDEETHRFRPGKA